MITEVEVLERIERFLAATGMTETTFGQLAARDGAFVQQLRNGRSPTLRKVAQIFRFIDQHQQPPSRG